MATGSAAELAIDFVEGVTAATTLEFWLEKVERREVGLGSQIGSGSYTTLRGTTTVKATVGGGRGRIMRWQGHVRVTIAFCVG